MTSRMVGSVLTLVILLFSVADAAAQTYTQMQWGLNKGVTPYAFGANINGTWRDLGTVSSGGIWSISSSNLSFTQFGTGAVATTVDARLKQTFLATDFGADPSAAADSCTAITNALNAAGTNSSTTNKTTVKFTAGTYVTSCWPTITDKFVDIIGDGANTTQISFTSASANAAGIRYSFSAPYVSINPSISGLSLYTNVAQSSNACVSATYNSAAYSLPSQQGINVRDVACFGNGTTYWADGIKCVYCLFGHVDHFTINGAANTGATVGYPSNTDRGISLDNSTDWDITNSHMYYVRKGISVDNSSEGAKVDTSSFVDVDYGVYGEATWRGPHFTLANSHINATTAGVHFDGGTTPYQSNSLQIHNNLIYRWLNATANPWSGIECVNGASYGCILDQFHDNIIVAFTGGGPTGTGNCFRLGSSATQIDISNNRCEQADYFADLGSSTASSIKLIGNSAQSITLWQNNTNVNAIWVNNTPVVIGSEAAVPSFGLNATQANVSFNQRMFGSNANTATTITQFNGGYPGLTITLYCNDTNTTLQNGANIGLAGGTDYTCPRVGATISLTYADTWREIGRAN